MTERQNHDKSTKTGRFLYVLETLFAGNRSKMARDLGISQAVVSKIALGQQEPGERVLRRLADHPMVNPQWLLKGEGEPLRTDDTQDRLGGWPIPIMPEPVHGRREQGNSPRATGHLLVCRQHYSPTRYFLEVGQHAPVTNCRRDIREGDLLLVETDGGREWTVDAVDGRLCVVASGPDAAPSLAAVSFDPGTDDEPPTLIADFFARSDSASKPVDRLVTLRIGRSTIRVVRDLDITSESPDFGPGRRVVTNRDRVPIQRGINLTDIVGVVVYLVRRHP